MALTHNSTLADSEPSWGSVSKPPLPALTYAVVEDPQKKTSWHAPHHWVRNPGALSEDLKVYTSGDMFLHRGGLIAAKAAVAGARTGKIPAWRPQAVPHLNRHLAAIGLDRIEMSWLPEVATAIALAVESVSLDTPTALDIIRYNLEKQPDVLIAAALSEDELVGEWGRFSTGYQDAIDTKGHDCKCARTLYAAAYDIYEEVWLRGLDVNLDGPLEVAFATMPGFDRPAASYIIEGEPTWWPSFQEEDAGESRKSESFARFMLGVILRMIHEETSRADIEAKMMEAASIDQARLDVLLSGAALPTLDELRAFAAVLWTSLEDLILAAEAAGATFAENDQDAGSE